MRLINNSKVRRSSQLYPLIDFAMKYSKYAHLARLVINDSPLKLSFCHGKTHRHWPWASDADVATPTLVILNLAGGAPYPRTSIAVPALGPITVRTWQEEFVLVLAHELRHVDQFWVGSHIGGQEAAAEQDAESFGIQVLDFYRRTRIAKAA